MLTTHSLRAGGATALYAAGYGEAEITYHGRWASASWLVYVHRTVARSGGVARAMFQQDVSLLRLAAGPSRRMGGDGTSTTSKGKGGGRGPRGVIPPPRVVPAKAAPTNRTPLSRAPSGGARPRVTPHAHAHARPAMQPHAFAPPAKPANGGSVTSTPAKGGGPRGGGGLAPQQCVLQSMFGYGSPVGRKI